MNTKWTKKQIAFIWWHTRDIGLVGLIQKSPIKKGKYGSLIKWHIYEIRLKGSLQQYPYESFYVEGLAIDKCMKLHLWDL